MSNEMINKVRASLENFETAGFETGWASPEKDLYFKYFGDPDMEVRRYAIAAFLMYLGPFMGRILLTIHLNGGNLKCKNG